MAARARKAAVVKTRKAVTTKKTKIITAKKAGKTVKVNHKGHLTIAPV